MGSTLGCSLNGLSEGNQVPTSAVRLTLWRPLLPYGYNSMSTYNCWKSLKSPWIYMVLLEIFV